MDNLLWITSPGHEPVLRDAVVELLAPVLGGVVLDATFGGGGHSRALLAAGAGQVIGLDRDPDAVERGRALAAGEPRFTMLEGRFGALDRHLALAGIGAVDGVLLDLGLSSFQLDDPARGFSFRHDGPLDMRMDRAGPDAAALVATAPEAELARILRELGEEPRARAVARAIVRARAQVPIATTRALAEVIRKAAGPTRPGLDPATRSFQALRIAVNDELGEIEQGLRAALDVLAPGGRLVVIAFHSLEDRLVKHFLETEGGRAPRPSRHLPEQPAPAARLRVLTRGALRPGPAEIARNPRARSARLRAAARLAEPLEDEVGMPRGLGARDEGGIAA